MNAPDFPQISVPPVTDTHEVSPLDAVDTHERHTHQILSEIGAGRPISQRRLATSLGIALGLTNLLVRRLIRKGWVRVVRIQPNRVTYLLTPAGLAEKGRMSRAFLQHSVRFYADARDRVRDSLAAIPMGLRPAAAENEPIRVVFYGVGDEAEIAYVCLQETSARLVGVVGESGRKNFFGFPVQRPTEIRGRMCGLVSFDCLVVASFGDRESLQRDINALGVDPDRVHWL